jgi:flagellar motor protein MotB
MEDRDSSEHLSSSLTDLMTSLMVIFILLLLVFISHTASKDTALRDTLLAKLQNDKDLIPQGKDSTPNGFTKDSIKADRNNPDAILVIIPNNLMGFDTEKYTLKEEGKQFIQNYMPKIASVLCDNASGVDSIVVEGHTDKNKWQGFSDEDSVNKNLTLSQQRSMSVVEEALNVLKEDNRTCFLDKLSATGRGEQGAATPKDDSRDAAEKANEASRQVIFRIHVKAHDASSVEQELRK